MKFEVRCYFPNDEKVAAAVAALETEGATGEPVIRDANNFSADRARRRMWSPKGEVLVAE